MNGRVFGHVPGGSNQVQNARTQCGPTVSTSVPHGPPPVLASIATSSPVEGQDRPVPLRHPLGGAPDVVADVRAPEPVRAGVGPEPCTSVPLKNSMSPGSMCTGTFSRPGGGGTYSRVNETESCRPLPGRTGPSCGCRAPLPGSRSRRRRRSSASHAAMQVPGIDIQVEVVLVQRLASPAGRLEVEHALGGQRFLAEEVGQHRLQPRIEQVVRGPSR